MTDAPPLGFVKELGPVHCPWFGAASGDASGYVGVTAGELVTLRLDIPAPKAGTGGVDGGVGLDEAGMRGVAHPPGVGGGDAPTPPLGVSCGVPAADIAPKSQYKSMQEPQA